MDKEKVLDDIFNNDPLGILIVNPKRAVAQNADGRLLTSFEEINAFVTKYNKRPEANLADVSEYQLCVRLKSLCEDDAKVRMLKKYDIHKLLPDFSTSQVSEPQSEYKKPKPIETLEDLLDGDNLGLLDTDDAGLFDFKHTPKITERESADFVAKRKPCKDFEKYEELLKQVQSELKSGERQLKGYSQSALEEGAFYVHNGVLFYLEKINITKKEHYRADGTRVRTDGRTRCIFENGTESHMLMRSVEKILYANGHIVTKKNADINAQFSKDFSGINDKDSSSGYIYVLQSRSSDPQIASIKNLYKIGFSTTKVEERVKNAENEPTYLMAPVDIVCAWECYNMDTHKLEQLLHNFFGNSCLELDIFDEKGVRHTPREWFIAPLEIIEKALDLIISGEVVEYVYDDDTEQIEKRK